MRLEVPEFSKVRKFVVKAGDSYWRTCYNGEQKLTSLENAELFSTRYKAFIKYFLIILRGKGKIVPVVVIGEQ